MSEPKFKLHEKVFIEAEIIGIWGSRGSDEILYDISPTCDNRSISNVEEFDLYSIAKDSEVTQKCTGWRYYDNEPTCENCGGKIDYHKIHDYKFCPYCGSKVSCITMTLKEGSNV